MLTIYGLYRSRASRNIWLANELGIPFKLVPIVQRYRLKEPVAADVVHTKSPAFLKINPSGHIPSIEDDGVVLHESLAINLYLAKKQGGPLAPANVAEDGQMSMWALWAATEVEPHSLAIAQQGPSESLIETLRGPFAVLDGALAKTGWLVGGRFTVADLNTAEIVRYAQGAPALFDAAPNVERWLAACHGRPAFKKMWEMREKEPT
ncbi:MAG: glutathione S-transferase family protein [Alphaproteobacteria bacterium]|nr:glutathione S-transferase family protein [Alphaproteobacteria bacterium]MBV8410629.1 glutathione S-transferase family protein [Alphaproteobacteria bacterium]